MIALLSGDYVVTKKGETPMGSRTRKEDTSFAASTPKRNLLGDVSAAAANKPNIQIPKISFFSGDEPQGKSEVTFREWRFEVQCLFSDPEDTLESTVITAIRRSLRGTAKDLLIPLGERASISAILQKLETFFGDISTNEMIMQEFFNAYQKSGESVTAFWV